MHVLFLATKNRITRQPPSSSLSSFRTNDELLASSLAQHARPILGALAEPQRDVHLNVRVLSGAQNCCQRSVHPASLQFWVSELVESKRDSEDLLRLELAQKPGPITSFVTLLLETRPTMSRL